MSTVVKSLNRRPTCRSFSVLALSLGIDTLRPGFGEYKCTVNGQVLVKVDVTE